MITLLLQLHLLLLQYKQSKAKRHYSNKMEFIQNIPCLMIHRSEDKEREAGMRLFESALQRKIQIVQGLNGNDFVKLGFPTKHPRDKEPTTPGNIGCTLSHIQILEAFLKMNDKYLLILEDDVEYVSNFLKYIQYSLTLSPSWDILFLGVNEIVESTDTESPAIRRVTRFWGTHAVILNRKAVTEICAEFKTSVKDGFALPADWLYSHTIKEHGLVAYCPSAPRTFVQQKEGLVSTCTGNVRKY